MGADICCIGLEFRKAGQWPSLYLLHLPPQDSSYKVCLYVDYQEPNSSGWFIRFRISYFCFLTCGCVWHSFLSWQAKAVSSSPLPSSDPPGTCHTTSLPASPVTWCIRPWVLAYVTGYCLQWDQMCSLMWPNSSYPTTWWNFSAHILNVYTSYTDKCLVSY